MHDSPRNRHYYRHRCPVFRVEEVTLALEEGYFLRYRGELTGDSIAAYEQLSAALQSYDITPLFRLDQGVRHPAGTWNRPSQTGPGLGQCHSVCADIFKRPVRRCDDSYTGPMPQDTLGQIWTLVTHIWIGWPFAVSLLPSCWRMSLDITLSVGRAGGRLVALFHSLPIGILGPWALSSN